ncbi:efflux transporter periplasmic adaptor subunit, partial [Nonlabens mediterrranea]|nr:efflux transporter periplasmic adaptor subunit [Nonlabens mediterrranea]
MKRTGTVITLIIILLLSTAGIFYIYQKDLEDPITYTTEQPTKETIIKETVATGSIVPK